MRRTFLMACVGMLAAGCGERDDRWEQPLDYNSQVQVHGMSAGVAVVDPLAERVIYASPETAEALSWKQVEMDRGYAASLPSAAGDRLVVLTRGDVPRRRADDEGPSLSVIDLSVNPVLDENGAPQSTRYELADPLSGLALDPKSEFALVYPSASDSSFVQNPNELVLVKLSAPPSESNPIPTTLRSFGGRPEGFTFTPELNLPGGKSRLLVVRTDRDVALIDLAAPEKPEITVKLSSSGNSPHPVGIAVDDGAPEDPNDARVAIRLEGDSSVILLDLLPTPADKAATSPHAFLPAPNIVDVGGVPGDVTFGKTDGGLRLLATVPTLSALVLVEPATGVATNVSLGAPFDHLSIVTDVVGQTTKGSDVALLWSTMSPEIAFVALGSTVGKPYKAVERLSLDRPVERVIDVPAPNDHLKVLVTDGGTSFLVLNMLARTASPLASSTSNTQMTASSDGQRLWMFAPGVDNLAVVGVDNLHPRNLYLNYPVTAAFDVARKDGGRAAMALHGVGSMGISLLDAEAPSVDKTTEYVGILLGDYQ
ncbi:MAG: hypothetical protein U0441_26265 [Polyangiaceae bacterium]